MHAHTRARVCRLTTFILLVGFRVCFLNFCYQKIGCKILGLCEIYRTSLKRFAAYTYSSYRTSREYNTFPWDIINIVLCQAKVRTTVNDVSLQKQTLAQVRQEIINMIWVVLLILRGCVIPLSQVAYPPLPLQCQCADCTEHVNDRLRIIKYSSRYHWEVLLCRLQILYTEINDGVKS